MDLAPLHASADAAPAGVPASVWLVFAGLLVLLAAAAGGVWAYVRWRFAVRQEGNTAS